MADVAPPSPPPPPSPPAAQRRRLTSALGCSTGVLIGVFLTLLIVVALAWVYSGSRFVQVVRSAFGLGPTQVLVGRPTVVRQIQQLQRLETVIFTLEKIMIGQRENAYLPPFLVGDRLLLIVHGEVIGGVDLGKVRESDVLVSGRRAVVQLPQPEIFTTRVDNEKTQVYSRETGLFSRIDPQLETEVRREGERQLRDAAMQNNILKIAGDNARSTLVSLLRGFGFEEVEIR